jgi:hypothetical protein
MSKLNRDLGDGDPSLEGGSGESRWLAKRCSADASCWDGRRAKGHDAL